MKSCNNIRLCCTTVPAIHTRLSVWTSLHHAMFRPCEQALSSSKMYLTLRGRLEICHINYRERSTWASFNSLGWDNFPNQRNWVASIALSFQLSPLRTEVHCTVCCSWQRKTTSICFQPQRRCWRWTPDIHVYSVCFEGKPALGTFRNINEV